MVSKFIFKLILRCIFPRKNASENESENECGNQSAWQSNPRTNLNINLARKSNPKMNLETNRAGKSDASHCKCDWTLKRIVEALHCLPCCVRTPSTATLRHRFRQSRDKQVQQGFLSKDIRCLVPLVCLLSTAQCKDAY